MKRTYKKLAGWIGIVAVVFAQLALSAYACPMMQVQVPVAATGATIAQADATDCCADSASASASLCHEHCKDSKVISPDALPDRPDFVAAFVISLPMLPEMLPSASALSTQYIERPSPPLSVLNCCFRI